MALSHSLNLLFSACIRTGNLRVLDKNGGCSTYGDGSGVPVIVRIADRKLEHQLVIDPQLALGEGYVEGRFTVEQGTIYDFLDLGLRNMRDGVLPRCTAFTDSLRWLARRGQQFNSERRSIRNVAHHYDIDGRIYDLFLDSDRQYSCGYFTDGTDLTQAQLAKKRHLAAKLCLRGGARVLDIGCGWGGLGLYLAEIASANVTGVTLSSEQLEYAQRRAGACGQAGAIDFRLQDYRHLSGTFDAIVSVGMFEHVGINHYRTFFRKLKELLTPNGVAVLHSIGRSDGPYVTNPFIARHIFPGGYIPALSEVLPVVERSGLIVTDIEILRLHYAETIRAWRTRFEANRAQAAALKGEEFCRLWEFYLAGSEVAFRYQHMMVFQMQLARRQDAVPLTRDYIQRAELELQELERQAAEPHRLAGE